MRRSEDQPWIVNGRRRTRARSHCLDLSHEYRFKLSQRLRRSSACKLREVVHHVHLVVISEVVRHVGPRAFNESRLAFESRFEPSDSREQLGAHTHLLDKSALKLSHAQSGPVSKSGDAHPPPRLNDPMRGGRNAIEAGRKEGP